MRRGLRDFATTAGSLHSRIVPYAARLKASARKHSRLLGSNLPQAHSKPTSPKWSNNGAGLIGDCLWVSEDELQRELNDSWAGTHAKDPTEVAWTQNASCSLVYAAASCKNGADVADGVIAVCVIEQVEEIPTEWDGRSFQAD